MEVTLSPKGGNPLHYHKRFTEKFTVIDGELNVQVGKTIHKLKKGDTTTARINDRHLSLTHQIGQRNLIAN